MISLENQKDYVVLIAPGIVRTNASKEPKIVAIFFLLFFLLLVLRSVLLSILRVWHFR